MLQQMFYSWGIHVPICTWPHKENRLIATQLLAAEGEQRFTKLSFQFSANMGCWSLENTKKQIRLLATKVFQQYLSRLALGLNESGIKISQDSQAKTETGRKQRAINVVVKDPTCRHRALELGND